MRRNPETVRSRSTNGEQLKVAGTSGHHGIWEQGRGDRVFLKTNTGLFIFKFIYKLNSYNNTNSTLNI